MGLHPWRPVPSRSRWWPGCEASIRPRVCTHGDRFISSGSTQPASWLQFGHGFAPMETSDWQRCRFRDNKLQFGHGFAPMETCALDDDGYGNDGLQFGHGFAPMETARNMRQLLIQAPLQFGHGFAPMETVGASVSEPSIYGASIRPWVCTHGDGETLTFRVLERFWLQFGHGFAPMETSHAVRIAVYGMDASIRPWVCTHGDTKFSDTGQGGRVQSRFNSAMGLHPWRHGYLTEVANELLGASIRPWVCTHGDQANLIWPTMRWIRLQFGHGFAPMETARFVSPFIARVYTCFFERVAKSTQTIDENISYQT